MLFCSVLKTLGIMILRDEMATGLVTPKCYAAPLRDCDGKTLTREHYISKKLLLRIGKTFTVDGLPMNTEGPRKTGEASLGTKVLCQRHNGALSRFDDEIVKLYDILEMVQRGENAGEHTLTGDCLELWALKVLVGMRASGNILRKTDRRTMPKVSPTAQQLAILFNAETMPTGWGFHVFGSPKPTFGYNVGVTVNSFEDGTIYGLTVAMLGLCFITSMVPLTTEPGTFALASYRPRGIVVEAHAKIALTWRDGHATDLIEMHKGVQPG